MTQPPKGRIERLLANIRHMRANPTRYTPDQIADEVAALRATQQTAAREDRKLSGLEKVAAVGSKLGSGATFGLLDEAVGLVDPDAKAVQRFLQEQLEEENPALALGAEIVGGFAMPGSFLGAAPRLAKSASTGARLAHRARQAGTVLGEGALQGGLAGVGNAKGSLEERLDDAVAGATAGSVVAGGLAGAGRGLRALRAGAAAKRGVHTPTLDELVMRTPDEDIVAAREGFRKMAGRRLGDETMVADVLPQGEAALRSQATASKGVRTSVDETLRSRSNRLANEGDARFSQHTKTTPQSRQRAVTDIVDEARDTARPLYARAEEEAARFIDTNPLDPKSITQRLKDATDQPYVKEAIDRIKADYPEYADMGYDDHRLLDQVYKDLGADIRYRQQQARARTATPEVNRALPSLKRQREALRAVMTERAPAYADALSAFADDMAAKEAFELGARKGTPADVIPDEMSGMSLTEERMYREGKATTQRPRVPNPDLGGYARFSDVLQPVADKEAAAVFKATHGEKAYREYMEDLLSMAKLQRMRAGGGESTTVDKLMEQLAVSDINPDLMGVVEAITTGNVRDAGKRLLLGRGLDRLLSNQKRAQGNADFLMRRGTDVPKTLDEMLLLRHDARQSEPSLEVLLRRKRPDGPRGPRFRGDVLAAREAGAITGRRE